MEGVVLKVVFGVLVEVGLEEVVLETSAESELSPSAAS